MASILGRQTLDGSDLLLVDTDPSAGAGTPAAVGSVATTQTGQTWVKTAVGDTSWSRFQETTASGVLAISQGGTGQSATPTNGQLLIGNGTGFSLSTLTGTTNQVNISNGSGTITLSTPQNIHSAASPTFSSQTLSSTTNQLILGTTNTTTINSSAPAASRIYTITDSGANASFVMTEGAQTVNGTKTFGVATLFADGIATAPGISFSADTNTGIYRIGADSIGITTNGANITTITSSGVVINNTTLNASAILQIDSTTRGILIPRMTSAQRSAIGTPTTGLQVFDTDLGTVCEYNGTTWKFEYRLNTTAIQSSTSNAYANITEFVTVSLDAGLYVLQLKGIMQSTATGTGVGLRLAAGTATVSKVVVNWNFAQAAAGTDKNFEYSQTATGDNVTSASVVTANSDFPVAGDGVFSLSAAGTVAIQIRTETNGTGVSIRPNSTVMFKKVG